MASSLFGEVRNRNLAKRLRTALDGSYTEKPLIRTGTIVAAGTVAVSGQRYQFIGPTEQELPAGSQTNVQNIQRPGAAIYAAGDGGLVMLSSGGGATQPPTGTGLVPHDVIGAFHTATAAAKRVVGTTSPNVLGWLDLLYEIATHLYLGLDPGGHNGLLTRIMDDGTTEAYHYELSDIYGRIYADWGLDENGGVWIQIGTADGNHLRYNSATDNIEIVDGTGTVVYALAGHLHTGLDGTGKLSQANTHESADTDSATSSLHHTIGVTATTAAAGNHTHAASAIAASTTSFDGALSASDDTVQKALDTLDDHTHASGDAADITYTPAVATDWDGDADPGDVDNALDQLAERVDDLEGAGYLTTVKRQATFTVEGEVSAAAGKIRIANHFGAQATINGVYLDIDTAPTGADLTVDIHLDGTTIFSTQGNRPHIDDGANAGNSTTLDTTAWPDGSYLMMDVDAVGSTVAGSDLTVTVVFTI